ncbi:MAG: YiiX/YebB-like N1pC/P60 family cysteine hydrolase [Candidatus Eremiobacteraeota bacterium]|nr:YiiX/YebB-like N1pC/P60 family cysteine hydrolase [Candidatus Eremiobacteraeota bacterium]
MAIDRIGIPADTAARRYTPKQPPGSASHEKDPQESFTHSASEEGRGFASSTFVKILGIRIPTVTKDITVERREKIMSLLQPGDLIIETNNGYPSWQVMEKVTLGSDYTHVGMYEGDGKMLEATALNRENNSGVVRADVRKFLQGPALIEIVRPPYKTPEDREAALGYMRSQFGKPYDSSFDFENSDKYYCSELVYKALQSMPNKMEVPLKEKVLGMNKRAVAPDAFRYIKDAEIPYSDGSNFWKNQASHYPVALGALAGGAAGWAAASTIGASLGPVGCALGLCTGLVLTTLIGNKIQTGQYTKQDVSSFL